jgi:hypothetical protein
MYDRLLDHLHAERSQLRGLKRYICTVPAFIGIDDEPGIGSALTHGSDTIFIALSAKLAFQQ